jgi:tetratricopeptide (TPR) repeat protein
MTPEAQVLIDEVDKEYERLAQADFYTVLGVPRNALDELIRERFRALAKRYHGDRYARLGLPQPTLQRMTQLLSWISRAHSTLTDPAKRREYDATLALEAANIPTDLGRILEAESLFKSGRNLLQKGHYQAALTKLDQASEMNPAEPEYAATASFAKYWTLTRDKKGKVEDRRLVSLIVKHLEDFLRENPKKDDICVYLGMIAKNEGDTDRAVAYFKEAYAINHHNLTAAGELRLHNLRSGKNKRDSFIKRLFGSSGGGAAPKKK